MSSRCPYMRKRKARGGPERFEDDTLKMEEGAQECSLEAGEARRQIIYMLQKELGGLTPGHQLQETGPKTLLACRTELMEICPSSLRKPRQISKPAPA